MSADRRKMHESASEAELRQTCLQLYRGYKASHGIERSNFSDALADIWQVCVERKLETAYLDAVATVKAELLRKVGA